MWGSWKTAHSAPGRELCETSTSSVPQAPSPAFDLAFVDQILTVPICLELPDATEHFRTNGSVAGCRIASTAIYRNLALIKDLVL